MAAVASGSALDLATRTLVESACSVSSRLEGVPRFSRPWIEDKIVVNDPRVGGYQVGVPGCGESGTVHSGVATLRATAACFAAAPRVAANAFGCRLCARPSLAKRCLWPCGKERKSILDNNVRLAAGDGALANSLNESGSVYFVGPEDSGGGACSEHKASKRTLISGPRVGNCPS